MNIYIHIYIIIGWKYIIACIVSEDKSYDFDFENNPCLRKHR